MRLLISTSTLPVYSGDGIPRFVLDLAHALSAHAEVCVLAPDAPGAVLHELIGDVSVHRFSYFWPRSRQCLAITNNRGMRDNLRGSLLAKAQVPSFLCRQAAAMRRLVRRNDIEVVNAHWLVPQGLAAVWALRGMPRVQLVLHVHAGDVYMLQRLAFGARIARLVARRADTIFADGSHVRDALDQLLGFESRAILQPMGVDSEQFSRQPGDDSFGERAAFGDAFQDGFVLFVGRLVEKKGTLFLIRAMRELRRHKPGIGLVIAGFGPEEATLRAEVERLRLQDGVRFVGRQSHPEIVRLLHTCRVAAVPSIIDSRGETEGMPTVVIEALAAGVPVVGSNVDGIPDVIRHRENGWLCREQDPSDLAEKLLLALDCDRVQLASAATSTAKFHDWQQVANNYVRQIRHTATARLAEAV